MKLKRFIITFVILFNGIYLRASTLHELRTVYLTEENYVGLDITQKFYYSAEKYYSMVREHEVLLPLSKYTEMGINFAYLNQMKPAIHISRVGDIKVHLNFKTDWLSEFMHINYFTQYNSGSGPAYVEFNTHPMESYGFPEFRNGLIFFKKFDYFSIHLNFFHVFRQEKIIETNENYSSEKEPNLVDGMEINIFEKDTYKRVFGFNYTDERNFFYKKYLKNDNLEYLIAVNTDLAYPFVPFLEFTFNHDFQIMRRKEKYYKYAPGSGYFRSQLICGFKSFFAKEKFIVKSSFSIPLAEMRNLYQWGTNLGIYIEF